MFYQLAYKIIDDRMTELEITNMITRLDYKHAQQLSWTFGILSLRALSIEY